MSDGLTPMPVIVTDINDEVNNPIPDPNVNWCQNADVLAYVLEHVQPISTHARRHRTVLEEEWRQCRRLVLMEHDDGQKYVGRSNAYVPTYKKAEDTLVAQLTRGLFPSDEFMDVQSMDGSNPEKARPVKDYLTYEVEKCARLRYNIKPFLRQYLRYGTGVAKVWFHKETTSRKKVKGRINPMMMMGGLVPSAEKDTALEGTRFSSRSIFNFYVWPPTVDSIDDATLVMEDIDVPKWYIEEMARKGVWANTEDMLAGHIVPEHDFNSRQQQLEMVGNSDIPTNGTPVGGDIATWRTVTECWVRIPLPASAYVGEEVPGEPVMCKVTLAGMQVLDVKRHPLWHGKLPYLVQRLSPEAGSFYGKGNGYVAKYLQYLINDFANQLNDNGTYAMNPMTLVNPGMLAQPLSPIKPGGVWYTTDVANGIKFDRPPSDQLQHGTNLMQMWVSMLMDTGGAPPIMQGTNAGKGARTATSSQILQHNAMNPIQDMVEDIEGDTLSPFLHMAYSLGQQYRADPVWMKVTGMAPVRVTPQDLVGDYEFKWMASSQAANQQQRAQQAMQLLQGVANPIMLQLLQQQGKMVNPVELLRRIYSDGFGFRNFDQFIVGAPPPMMPGQPPVPGQPPGPGAPPGGPPPPGNPGGSQYSPNGGSPGAPMEAGEGETFSDVRDGANVNSADLGALGGFGG